MFMGLSTRDNLRVAGVDVDAGARRCSPSWSGAFACAAACSRAASSRCSRWPARSRRKPRVLLADELSMGLAPLIVKRLLEAVARGADEQGTAVLLVEQHVRKALAYADRAYVMRRGRIELSGTATELSAKIREIEDKYLSTHTTRG